MKKLIQYLIILFLVNGACKQEEVNPYQECFGFFEGESYVRDSTKNIGYFCEGRDLKVIDMKNNNLKIVAYCNYYETSENEFINLRFSATRIDTLYASPKVYDLVKYVDVIYTKTNRIVGTFIRYPDPSVRLYFDADSLLSTKGVYLRRYFGAKKY